MTKWLQESWLTKPIVVMVMLIFASNLVVGCGTVSPEPPTPTPTSLFSYLVRVQAMDTGEAIPNAEVKIEVGGKATLDEITDTDGYARISIDSSYAGRAGKLIVEATGYEGCEKIIDLTEGTLPKVIQLRKSVAVSSPAIMPTTLTATPSPTPTNMPEPTPTPVFVEAPRDLDLRVSPSLRDRIVDTIPKGSLFKAVCHDDENREWALVEAKSGLRGWTFLGDDTYIEIPTSSGESTPTVLPAASEVPATPTALPPPILISPKTVDKRSFLGDVALKWDWNNITLEKGWFYSVRIGQDAKTGHPEEPLPCFHYRYSFASVYEGDDLAEFCEPGRYYWEVVVVARNEEFVRKGIATKYIPEEVAEYTEISEMSTREYFDLAGEPTPTILPTPTVTPEPPTPTPTAPVPTPTDTPTPCCGEPGGSGQPQPQQGKNATPSSHP